jgi:hypothetical protein
MIVNLINTENVLVFKTNMNSKREAKQILSSLNENEVIAWSIDLEDRDKVLRIVSPNISSEEIIYLAKVKGLECMELE